jgi:hypothetical protein
MSTTCAGCDTTATSNRSRTATATASPPRATVEPCSCPGRITAFSATDAPKSPHTQPAPQDSAPPTARTKQPSTTYSSVPGSPHEQDSNLTHPQRQTRIKSSSSHRRKRAADRRQPLRWRSSRISCSTQLRTEQSAAVRQLIEQRHQCPDRTTRRRRDRNCLRCNRFTRHLCADPC